MTQKSEYFSDLFFKKLKTYNSRKIFLEKETLKKFISYLIQDK